MIDGVLSDALEKVLDRKLKAVKDHIVKHKQTYLAGIVGFVLGGVAMMFSNTGKTIVINNYK